MKKLGVLLLSMLMISTLLMTGCSVGSYSKGTLSKESYESKFWNMKFSAGEEYGLFNKMNMNNSDYIDQDIIMEDKIEMAAGIYPTMNAWMCLYTEKSVRSVDKAIEQIKNKYKNNSNVEVSDTSTHTILDKEYKVLPIKYSSKKLCNDYIVRVKSGRALVICMIYPDGYKDTAYKMFDAFSEYEGDVVAVADSGEANAYTVGTMSDKTYSSEFLNLKINVSEDYMLATEQELTSYLSEPSASNFFMKTVYEIAIGNTKDNNQLPTLFVMTMQPMFSNIDVDKFMNKVYKKSLEAQKIEFTEGITTVAGAEYRSLSFVKSDTNVKHLYKGQGDVIVFITVNYATSQQNQVDELLQSFTACNE